ncbi:MAG: RNA polymerase sigma factor [Mycobacterium leprae]
MDEWQHVAAAKAGDQAAYTWLVEQHGALVLRLTAFYLGRHDAADAAQEVWSLVYRKLWQLEEGSKFQPWLRQLIFYYCMTYRRKRAKRRQREIALSTEAWLGLAEFVAADGEEIAELFERQELRREISRALDRMPGEYGLLLRLFYIRQLTYPEITALTQLPLSTVKWRLHQGRKLLRDRLAVLTAEQGGYRA